MNIHTRDNRLIDGVVVKKRIIQEVRDYTATQQNMPQLVSVLVGDTPEADVYMRNQARGQNKLDCHLNKSDGPQIFLSMNANPTFSK